MIIYLNGPINAGKTTISKLLLDRLPRSVHLEVDDLGDYGNNLTLFEAIPLVAEDTLNLTRAWIGRGFHVIVSWPISEAVFSEFDALGQELLTPVHAFTLKPRLEVALRNRGNRPLTAWESNRIKEMYADLGATPALGPVIDLGTVIDNSDLTAEATVDLILTHIDL